jgi:hypothetical protein
MMGVVAIPTLADAERLHKAFGPNTVVFETMTPREFLDEWRREGEMSTHEFIEICMQREEHDLVNPLDDRSRTHLLVARLRVLALAGQIDRRARGW